MVLVVKNPPANVEEVRVEGSNPGSGRSSGEGHGNPLQYSCLENPTDRGAWWATVHRGLQWTLCSPWGCKELYTTECVHTYVPSSKVGSATVPIAQVGKLSFGETQWPNLEIALITTTLHVCSLHGYFIIAKLCYSF